MSTPECAQMHTTLGGVGMEFIIFNVVIIEFERACDYPNQTVIANLLIQGWKVYLIKWEIACH